MLRPDRVAGNSLVRSAYITRIPRFIGALIACMVIALLFLAVGARAQTVRASVNTSAALSGSNTPLRVGIQTTPPFVIKNDDGDWSGIGIDLINTLSQVLEKPYTLVETPVAQMVSDVADGKLDAAIGSVPINGRDEKKIDFSQPFFSGGAGVAVRFTDHLGPRFIFKLLASPMFLSMLGLLVGPVFVIGALIWFLERRANPEQFEPRPGRGMFSGFWWATVTMTTVGYGDKAPVTFLGRLLAMFWMFAALILAAITTAQLAAGFSASAAMGVVHQIGDLAAEEVGTVKNATAQRDLASISIKSTEFATVDDGLKALEDGDIDAFVYDRATLQWALTDYSGVYLTNLQFGQENYGLMLPNHSPDLESVNIAILNTLETTQWALTVQRYLPQSIR